MKDRGSEYKNASGLKWLLSLAFAAIGFAGYFSLAFVSGNYLDALAIPVIIGFIWLGVYKQQFALAVSLAAVSVLLMLPAMVAGLMRFDTLMNMLVPIIIIVFSLGAYRLGLRKAIAMFIFFALGVFLLYVFDYLDSGRFVVLMVGSGGGLLGSLLFAKEPSRSFNIKG
ncbi:MAG: hypothetical protein HF973_06350 [Chloroflexi bacterium]|nr:hypothetical protein [Chloroflexota bacterium]